MRPWSCERRSSIVFARFLRAFARLAAFLCRVARPDSLLHQAERDAIAGCGQRGMDFQPFAAGVIEVAQASGMRMRGIQKLGGVLQHQHRIGVRDTATGGITVSSANAVSSHRLGVQKAVGSLGGSPRAAGMRNAGGRLGQRIGDDTDKALGEAGIAEVGGRQFLSSPALVIWE